MKEKEIEDVIETWMKEVEELQSKYTWVQVFENKGEIMGCSNPHPHSQIWASSYFPNEPRVEDSNQRNYFQHHSTPLLLDYAQRELQIHEAKKEQSRVVVDNQHWVVVVSVYIYYSVRIYIFTLSNYSFADVILLLRYLFGRYGLMRRCWYQSSEFRI